MIVSHRTFQNPFSLADDRLNFLVVENRTQFAVYIRELKRQCSGLNGDFVFSEDGRTIEPSKGIKVVVDPLDVDSNDTTTIKQLYTALQKEATSEARYDEVNALATDVFRIVSEIAYTQPFAFTIGEANPAALFKISNVRFDPPEELAGRLLEFAEISRYYMGTELFVTVNLDLYMSDEDLTQFSFEASYKKLRILSVNSNVPRADINPNLRILDNDLCEISEEECDFDNIKNISEV